MFDAAFAPLTRQSFCLWRAARARTGAGSSCVTSKLVECPAGLNPQQIEFILKLVDAALHVIQRHAIWSDNKGAIDLHGAYDGHRNPCWFVILVALDAKRDVPVARIVLSPSRQDE